MRRFVIILLLLALPLPGFAQEIGRETGLPTPRFVSLKADEVNLRKGPGTRYPIEWVYQRKTYPVEVLEEFGHWRRVRDGDKTSGWLHKQMLSGSRYVLITGQKTVSLLQDPKSDAPPAINLEPGVIAHLEKCKAQWCLLKIGKHEGWLKKSKFYGAYAKELYNP